MLLDELLNACRLKKERLPHKQSLSLTKPSIWVSAYKHNLEQSLSRPYVAVPATLCCIHASHF